MGEGSHIGHPVVRRQYLVCVIFHAEGPHIKSFHDRGVLRTSTFYSKLRKIVLRRASSAELSRDSGDTEVTLMR